MLRSFFRFIYDLCIDGYAVVSFAAPIASLAFTAAKFFELPLAVLHELSYAWALLPLTLWLLVAYVRRRAQKDRAAKRAKMHDYYVWGLKVLQSPVTPETFDAVANECTRWATETATWLENNLGLAARERFLDRSRQPNLDYNNTINEQHHAVLKNVNAWRNNLADLIETDAWDRDA
jgi:hypothetical protein